MTCSFSDLTKSVKKNPKYLKMTWNSSIQKMTSLLFDSSKLVKIIILENITWILTFRNMTSAFSDFRKSVKFTTNSLQMTSNSSF